MTPLLISLVIAYTPAEAQALFTEANDAANRQEHQGAIEKYQRLIAAGQGGPDVLFNLGSTYLVLNELGPAVLHLTRAQKLSSADDIAAQLAVAQARQADQVIGAEEAIPFVQRLASAVDERWVSIGFLLFWWLAFVAWSAWLRRRGLALSLAAAVLSFIGVALGGVVGAHAWVSTTVHESVVMSATTPVREFPKDSGKVSFEVHAGLLVRVMEESGQYVRIRLPNALEGWVERSALTAL